MQELPLIRKRGKNGRFVNQNRLIKKICPYCSHEFYTYFSINKNFCNRNCSINFRFGETPKIELNESLSYILGSLCGDAWISRNKSNQQHCYLGLETIDIDFIKAFQNACQKVFKFKIPTTVVKPKYGWGRKNRYSIRVHGLRKLRKIIEFGSFGCYSWIVPQEVKNGTSEIKHAFLRGFFDSEGSVSNWQIAASSINKEGLSDINNLLNSLGITSKFYDLKERMINDKKFKGVRLCIQTRKSIKLFKKKIGFSIERKQKKINQLIKRYEDSAIKRKYHTIEEFYKVICLREKFGYGAGKISKLTGISEDAIKGWLIYNSIPFEVKEKMGIHNNKKVILWNLSEKSR